MRRRAFLTTVLAASLSPTGCARRNPAASPKKKQWRPFVTDLDVFIRQQMADTVVPGLSIALIADARVVWRGAYGVRDSVTKTPVTHDTVFQAASMSKPVFAYAFLKLCEKGILNLDTPLTKYQGSRFEPNEPRLDLITPRLLLSHSSGFREWRSSSEPLVQSNPGEKYHYSGEGYYYLQSVVTHLTGRVNPNLCDIFEGDSRICASDIDRFMTTNLLRPFGMTSSSYFWNGRIKNRLARGHDAKGLPLAHKAPTPAAVTRYCSSGALLTTPTDYARFLIETMDPKRPDEFRLTGASLAEMTRPHIKVNDTASWALGWAIEPGIIAHGGDNSGFHCFAVASPMEKWGYVIMTNGTNGRAILHKVMGEIHAFART